jgi:glycosyltransferase involved in cell wall biosynthesis
MVYYLKPKSLTVKCIAKLISDTPHEMLYLNSFFDPVFTIKILLGRILGLVPDTPVILAPRGELVDGPLKLKYKKKMVYIQVAKRLRFYKDLIWQASSEHEAQDIIRVMKIDPSLVHIALDLPTKAIPDVPIDISVQSLLDSVSLRVIFLNRLTREKNLDYALRVLSKVNAKIVFDIYGPVGDQKYWNECEELIRHLPANIIVSYFGSVEPSQVVHIFSRYDLFFFPTRGENYGHVIVESLTAGTRVLISNKTPWLNLQVDGLGWDKDLDQMDSFVAIIEKMALEGGDERLRKRILVKANIMERLLDPATLEANRQLFNRQLFR